MPNYESQSSCRSMIALILWSIATLPSLVNAQTQHKIFAFTPYPVCMRPVDPCGWLCQMLSLIGAGSSPSDEGVGIEGVWGQCEGDRVVWTRREDGGILSGRYTWFTNVKTGKCLHVQGDTAVQRTCDFVATDVTHPQIWFVYTVRNGADSPFRYYQLTHQQPEGGVKCLVTNSPGWPFYSGAMSLGDCVLPPTSAPFSQQFAY
jgi:hypothetical protein